MRLILFIIVNMGLFIIKYFKIKWTPSTSITALTTFTVIPPAKAASTSTWSSWTPRLLSDQGEDTSRICRHSACTSMKLKYQSIPSRSPWKISSMTTASERGTPASSAIRITPIPSQPLLANPKMASTICTPSIPTSCPHSERIRATGSQKTSRGE